MKKIGRYFVNPYDHGLKLKIKRLRDFWRKIAIFQNIQYNRTQIVHTTKLKHLRIVTQASMMPNQLPLGSFKIILDGEEIQVKVAKSSKYRAQCINKADSKHRLAPNS